jgi:thiamine pyrophosphate-dependent acetolactate synthase large subunit-like protein
MGVSARRVERANELAPTLREALASPRPVLIDVVLA